MGPFSFLQLWWIHIIGRLRSSWESLTTFLWKKPQRPVEKSHNQQIKEMEDFRAKSTHYVFSRLIVFYKAFTCTFWYLETLVKDFYTPISWELTKDLFNVSRSCTAHNQKNNTIQTDSEGWESRSRLGLETKGTNTLGLVQNFGTCLVSVSSQMKIFGTV